MTMISSVKYVQEHLICLSICLLSSVHFILCVCVHFTQASSSVPNSIEVTPIHQDTNDPPQSKQDDNEWEVLETPEHVKEKQRSQSSSELLSLNTEVILDRPGSADGKIKGSLYILRMIIY